jgi:hypothetical protein
MRKVLFLLSLCVSLLGCDEKKSELYYFQHPKLLSKKIVQCQRDGASDCTEFYAYGARFSQLIDAFRDNTQLFGLRIMHAQMQEADLKRSLELAKQSNNVEAMAALNHQIQVQANEVAELRAVVSLFIRV